MSFCAADSVAWVFVNTTQTPPTAQNDALDLAPLCGGCDLRLTTTAKAITPFAGLASFTEWLRHIGFCKAVADAMPFAYRSPRALPLVDIFTAFLVSVILGASRFSHCDWLRFDSALHALLGIVRFPANDAILRFFGRFSQGCIERCFRPLTRWLLALLMAPAEGFTLDMDSTIFNREGSQEGAAKGCPSAKLGALSLSKRQPAPPRTQEPPSPARCSGRGPLRPPCLAAQWQHGGGARCARLSRRSPRAAARGLAHPLRAR